MATTETRETGLIRGLRDRLRRSRRRQQMDRETSDLARRADYPMAAWDPFRMMREMLLMPQIDRDMWLPQFDVRENGHSIRVIADVPGVRSEDLDVSLTGNRLTITGQRIAEQRSRDENVTCEREFGQFIRTFTLPDNVDAEHVTSELRDGVLTVVVPLKAGSRARKIQIGGTQPKA
jgi:HSP20 family protein